MQMTDAELGDFRSRCLQAATKGYLVARAEEYADALEAEAGSVDPPDGTPGSAAHLFELATAALAVRGGEKKKAPAAKKAELAKPSAKAPPLPPAPPAKKAEAKAEPKAEPKKEEQVPATYDSWTYDELYAEAQEREIPNRSKMSKEELIEALEESDEAEKDK